MYNAVGNCMRAIKFCTNKILKRGLTCILAVKRVVWLVV